MTVKAKNSGKKFQDVKKNAKIKKNMQQGKDRKEG